MANKVQGVRGMNDVLPDDARYWAFFDTTVQRWLHAYGYREIRMPILERTELFVRSIGEVTDIVEKEMYTFTDELNGEQLTLRPEGTASCVRAVTEHNLLYPGPQRLWQDLGLDGITLELNSLGSAEARARYRTKLVAYLESRAGELDEDAKRRMHSNPLRVLDSKNPAMQTVIEAAPQLADDLDDESAQAFAALQGSLRAAGLAFRINPRLVRGLDYYNGTVFEWVTDRLGAQGTVCAGGRYDGLIEQIGGKPAPACGFAMGVERLLALLVDGGAVVPEAVADAYIVRQGDTAMAFGEQVAERMRDADLAVILHCGGGSFKSQMKKADGSGARFAVIIGDDEAQAGMLTVKSLRVEQDEMRREQVCVSLSEACEIIKTR